MMQTCNHKSSVCGNVLSSTGRVRLVQSACGLSAPTLSRSLALRHGSAHWPRAASRCHSSIKRGIGTYEPAKRHPNCSDLRYIKVNSATKARNCCPTTFALLRCHT